MATFLDRAKALEAFNAPPEVGAMVLLAHVFGVDGVARTRFKEPWDALSALHAAAERPASGYELLPELGQMVGLHTSLLSQLRGLDQEMRVRPTPHDDKCPAPTRVFPTVERTVEASTPWITSTLPFTKALEIADHPTCWVKATPQMKVCSYVPLPADGALWRGRLKKETNFGMPVVTGLVSRETIDITAEGENADGRGYRRYSYLLHSSDEDEGLLAVIEDTGWIEISGDCEGCQVRLYKRATVVRELEDPLAALLEPLFMAELWMWATGFCVAAGEPSTPAKAPRLPADPKTIPPAAKDAVIRVAVLGGGPAGLACAWLLSNPDCDGQPAWDPPAANPRLTLKISLIEKESLPGGKAASVRGTGANASRIEEHGLHVVMGFYENLQRILTLCKAEKGLLPLRTVRVPRKSDGPIASSWAISFEPRKPIVPRMSLLEWFGKGNHLEYLSDRVRRLALQVDGTNPFPRPMLRAFVGTWQRVATLHLADTAWTPLNRLLFVFIQLVLALLSLSELKRDKEGELQSEPGEVAALAELLRWAARCAWGGRQQRPETQLLSELLELLTTITIGLDKTGLLPTWAIANPDELTQGEYIRWIRALQLQDHVSLDSWLQRYGIVAKFSERSRILDALTAGLFTKPDEIAAGTFIHGLGRLFLNYVDAPFNRLSGGTGEAVIGPMYKALIDRGVEVELGCTVTGLSITDQVVRFAEYKKCLAADLKASDAVKQWDPPNHLPPQMTLPAEVFVLAIPPFCGTIHGLPDPLKERLSKIESCATVGLESWASGEPNFQGSLVSGIGGPLRCSAAMEHLDERPYNNQQEGSAYGKPVYACGEIDDCDAEKWKGPARDAWLAKYGGQLQSGKLTNDPFVSINVTGSRRYVSANPATQEVRPYVFETGIKNLWLAGDWTRTALSCGSIEAAITSGLEAARAILQELGCKVNFKIAASILREEEEHGQENIA